MIFRHKRSARRNPATTGNEKSRTSGVSPEKLGYDQPTTKLRTNAGTSVPKTAAPPTLPDLRIDFFR